jgi:hypothetical protein
MSLMSNLGPNGAYLPFGGGPRNCEARCCDSSALALTALSCAWSCRGRGMHAEEWRRVPSVLRRANPTSTRAGAVRQAAALATRTSRRPAIPPAHLTAFPASTGFLQVQV